MICICLVIQSFDIHARGEYISLTPAQTEMKVKQGLVKQITKPIDQTNLKDGWRAYIKTNRKYRLISKRDQDLLEKQLTELRSYRAEPR
jgi:hypothetical protein